MGWKLDWRKFRQYLLKQHNVTQAYLFIGYMAENESLYEHMHELGYLVVLKPTLEVKSQPAAQPQVQTGPATAAPHTAKEPEDKEKSVVKGNVDAELVLYAMKELPNYSQAIIVSGDGDFVSLIEYLAEQRKLANILTPNWQYSSLFKPYEDKIIRLDQLRRQLSYISRKKK